MPTLPALDGTTVRIVEIAQRFDETETSLFIAALEAIVERGVSAESAMEAFKTAVAEYRAGKAA